MSGSGSSARQRDRLLAVLRGERPDRLPWYAMLSFWWEQQDERGLLPVRWQGANGLLAVHCETGAGYYWGPGFWQARHHQSEVVQIVTATHRFTEHRTPLGSITRVEQYLPESQCYAPVKWPVQTREDFRVLRFLISDVTYEPLTELYCETERLWGGAGVPLLIPPTLAPVPAVVNRWCGVENATMAFLEFPEDVEETLSTMAAADDHVYEILASWPEPILVEFNDNLSSDIIGGLLKHYGRDYYARRIRQLHAAGKSVSVHNDGRLRGLYPYLSDQGFDVVEALTPEPTGDVPPRRLREVVGPKPVIWGGIPGAIFSPVFPLPDFQQHVLDLVECYRHDRRFVVGIADLLPPDGEIERVRWVSEVIEEQGVVE